MEEEETCLWEYNNDYDYWQTSCCQDFTINEGTPKGNGFKFCYHCGKKIQEWIAN
jgi:hypothetical protein